MLRLHECYSREQIHKIVGGGSLESYLPHKDGRVLCACLGTDLNPDAPRVILPGTGVDIEKSAKMLVSQGGSVPTFIKLDVNQWEYRGTFRVKHFTDDPGEISKHAKKTGRTDITMVICMEPAVQKITPSLWFDGQASIAADFYVSVFRNSKIIRKTYYPEGSPGVAGSVMTVQFILDGVEFVAINGGSQFKFTPAISFVANCETQEEVDRLWQALSAGGQEVQCGWLTDRFGVSWQIVPMVLPDMLSSADTFAAQRAFTTMLGMKKLDIAALKRALEGG